MKNLKLLLATTAMLSAGAMVANAVIYNNQAEFNVTAEFVTGGYLSNHGDMNLGKMEMHNNYGGETINPYMILSPDGTVTTNHISYFGGAVPAVINAYQAKSLAFPEEITLLSTKEYCNTNPEDSECICGTLKEFTTDFVNTNAGDYPGDTEADYHIGATFYYAGSGTYTGNTTCIGKFTVTAVLPNQ